MSVVAPTTAKVDQSLGPVTLQTRITGTQLTTNTDVNSKPPITSKPNPLIANSGHALNSVQIPPPAKSIVGATVTCNIVLTAMAANQHWGTTLEAVQNGAVIGSSSDSGDLAAKGDMDVSVLTLVFQ